MSSRRLERVQKELRSIIGLYLLRGLKEELPCMVSVTRVVASGDLRSAKVFLSHLGAEEEAAQALQTLKAARGEIQKEVARELPMKFCPRLEFLWDKALYIALDVDSKLRGLLDKDPS